MVVGAGVTCEYAMVWHDKVSCPRHAAVGKMVDVKGIRSYTSHPVHRTLGYMMSYAGCMSTCMLTATTPMCAD